MNKIEKITVSKGEKNEIKLDLYTPIGYNTSIKYTPQGYKKQKHFYEAAIKGCGCSTRYKTKNTRYKTKKDS